jgi:thioredoxin 1
MTMNRNIPILLLSVFLININIGCNSNKERKEAAKEYLRKQMTETSAEETTSGPVKEVNDQNFTQSIAKGVTLVDFWATWCAPCRMQAPIVEEIAKEMSGKANICKVDIDKNPATTQKFQVQNIPTIIIFKDGIEIQTFVGLQDKSTLMNILQQLTGK